MGSGALQEFEQLSSRSVKAERSYGTTAIPSSSSFNVRPSGRAKRLCRWSCYR